MEQTEYAHRQTDSRKDLIIVDNYPNILFG